MSHYRVTVERNTLRFSAAHFTTFGEECEPLHGHNYDVFVEVNGDLTEDSWVVDFVELKRLVTEICRQLDHKFLLPLESRRLEVQQNGSNYEIRFKDRRYVIPSQDVAALPVDNSTAERLAEWIARTLALRLQENGKSHNLRELTVSVEEAPGQAGWFMLQLHSG
ncbi:MAG TPA: 6-pyruvoyl tetrahydropterin synthase family protein [Dehalococcoidia bacterium]|nr:6-pyruvoyl tetrahydropterin synthase family protein [Dehalococcoidia bacterium]